MSENPDQDGTFHNDDDKALEDLGFTVIPPERFLRYTNQEENNAIQANDYRGALPGKASTVMFHGYEHHMTPFCWCHPVVTQICSVEGKVMDLQVSHIYGTVN